MKREPDILLRALSLGPGLGGAGTKAESRTEMDLQRDATLLQGTPGTARTTSGEGSPGRAHLGTVTEPPWPVPWAQATSSQPWAVQPTQNHLPRTRGRGLRLSATTITERGLSLALPHALGGAVPVVSVELRHAQHGLGQHGQEAQRLHEERRVDGQFQLLLTHTLGVPGQPGGHSMELRLPALTSPHAALEGKKNKLTHDFIKM